MPRYTTHAHYGEIFVPVAVVDAIEYGVVADGTTDDTAGWVRAFTALTTQGGGTLQAPVGTSIVTGISVPASTTLRGHGSASIIKLANGSNQDVVKLSGTFARVQDLRILGNSAGQSSGFKAGVNFLADDCTAERVRVEDCFKYGIYAANVNRPQIRECQSLSSLYIGIYLETTGAADMLDPEVTRCTVDRSSIGIGIVEGGLKLHGGGGKKILRPRVAHNIIRMPSSPTSSAAVGIETFGGVDQAVIIGNAVLGCSIGISCDTSDKASITGNTVVGAKTIGIEMVTSASPACSGNTVDGASLTTRGISVTGSNDTSTLVSVSGNTVTGCVTNGIYSQGATQIAISGNTVRGAVAMIQVANCTYVSVAGNTLADPSLVSNNGVQLDNCTWLTVTGNAIAGVAQNGVLIFASTAITIRSFVFANAIDINAGSSVSTNLSGGAVLSTQSMLWGNSDGAANILNHAGNVRVLSGAGTPEAAQAAGIGSLYVRTDGSAATTLYVKESGVGNTGWIAK